MGIKRSALEILISGQAIVLDTRIIMACLGLLSTGDTRFSVSDVQHIGKYLLSNSAEVRDFVADILEFIDHSRASTTDCRLESRKLLSFYLDPAKNLHDVLPPNLTIGQSPEHNP